MKLQLAGVVGHIVVDVLLLPLVFSTAVVLLFAGTLSVSVQALAMALVCFAYIGFLVVDIILTLTLGLAPPGSRRAIAYRWYMLAIVAWLVYGLCQVSGLNAPLSLLCAVAVTAGLFLRQQLLRRIIR